MELSGHDARMAKRQKIDSPEVKTSGQTSSSAIFAPYRTVGLVSPTSVPFTSTPLGKTSFQITSSVGRSLQTYDLRRGLNLVFVTQPQTPADITATLAWKDKVIAAWGDARNGEEQGAWVYKRGRRVGELELPPDLGEPLKQLVVFGAWIVACGVTRIEIWKSDTLEHYTSLFPTSSTKGGNELTGGITTMPTCLNKIFAGRKDGWTEIWNVSTGKLIYTILPPSGDSGSVTCLEPTPALSLMAIAYSGGAIVVHDVLRDQAVLAVEAGNPSSPVSSISFRTDGAGAGQDGRKEGVMATATASSGDVTFWDLNGGGRVMGVLRSAHNPPSRDGQSSRGGINRIEFLPGQSIVVTSGKDNSLKTWIFDETSFSPVPRILHSRSGHSGPVNCLLFMPSDFDGAEAGNKWIISGGRDRSLWGWSLRRDGQSSELSQGNIRKKAKSYGLLAGNLLKNGSSTSLEDIKAPEITAVATSLNRDGGIGALPGKQPIWLKGPGKKKAWDAEISGMTGWESVVTAHKDDPYARTWFWGRKRAGRWALPTGDGTDVSTVAISSCGTFALVGSVGGGIDMYNLQSGQHRQRFPSKLTPAQARQLKAQQLKHTDSVVQLQGGSEGSFPAGTGRHTKPVTGILVDPLNKAVISCGMDGKVKFWDFLTGNLLRQIDWPGISITKCRYYPGNDLAAYLCNDCQVRVVDTTTLRVVREFSAAKNSVKLNDFCFSHDGRWIIAAGQDAVVRIWDLPTSHLIDAIKLSREGKAVATSSTGEYLAVVVDGELGVHLWTNKSLFKHVAAKQISEASLVEAAGPTASGEGGQTLLEAALASRNSEDAEDGILAPTVDQLSADMMTLSLVPRSRWQTLVHLDLIKQRNKPKEAPKVPEQAPFFLPSGPGREVEGPDKEKRGDGGDSRITKLDRSRSQEVFTVKLRSAAARGDYADFIDHLKTLSPSRADMELRSLSMAETDDVSNEMLHFIRALTSRLKSRRDYELTQAWMTVLLRLHFDIITDNQVILDALEEWKAFQERESARLDELVGYCSGVVGFFRSPRA